MSSLRLNGKKPGRSAMSFGYVRASTSEQKNSPQVQRRAILKCAGTIDEWYEDLGISGAAGLDKRPGLSALLCRLRAGDRLIVQKRDRLSRDSFVSAFIMKESRVRRFEVISADGHGNGDDPESRLLAEIVSAFSAYELQLIRARTRGALAARRARGQMTGACPFGFKVTKGGRLIPIPAEQAVLRRIVGWRKAARPYLWIAKRLNALGVKPKRAKRWSGATVAAICRRHDEDGGYAQRYAGAFGK